MGELTQLLEQARQGDESARQKFFTKIHGELERLAKFHLDKQTNLTLIDTPALVREAYLRIANQEVLPGKDRNAFLSYASHAMHSVIVDYIRSRNALHNKHQSVTLNTGIADDSVPELRVDLLVESLEKLSRIDQRAYQVVEMRFFGGMETADIAEVLNIHIATVNRDWVKARALLLHLMGESSSHSQKSLD